MQVMGVVNVTPDSFSDGGRYLDASAALAHARRLVGDGADWVDVGGESTRPRAEPVDAAEELRRVLPVVDALAADGIAVSIDTRKAAVAEAAVAAGARMVNDVSASLASVAAATGVAFVAMHMQGDPATMQDAPRYDDVVAEVREFLLGRVAACTAAGIPRERLCVDPGIGFGKRPEHNLALLARLDCLSRDGLPVLVGVSRKSLIGMITARPTGERLAGSIALAALCAERGAAIVRAHDVAPTVDAVRIGAALRGTG